MKIFLTRESVEQLFRKYMGDDIEILWTVENPNLTSHLGENYKKVFTELEAKLVKPPSYNWAGRWLIDGDEIIDVEVEDIASNSFWIIKETERGISRVRHIIDKHGYITPLGRRLMNRIDVAYREGGRG